MNEHQLHPSDAPLQLVAWRRLVVCFGAVGALAPGAQAQATVAWTQPTRGVSVAVDAADNVYTVDYEMQLGRECEVTKRDVLGNHLWTAHIDQTDSTKWERAQWIAVDSTGAAVVCATLMSGFSNPVVAASVVIKFDTDGAPLWRIVYENGFDGTSTRKCLIDVSDDIYVLGTGVGAGGVTTKVKKFAPDGTTRWTYLDAAGIGVPVNFKFAGDGHLVLAARSVFGSVNGFAKVDRGTGAVLWSLPGVSSVTVGDAAGDTAGNTYVVHGEFVPNGGTVVRKLAPGGATLWSRTFVSAGSRIEVGPDALPVVSGFPSSTSAGAAFFKVDAAGSLVWANLDADGPLMLLLHAQLSLDGAGNAYLAAGLLGSMAVCKVHNDGASAWTVTMPGGSGAAGLTLGRATGSVFVVGGNTVRLADPIGVGASYCGPATVHTGGTSARITATGSNQASANNVTLAASSLPLNQFGFFLTSQTQGFVANSGMSQGNLCLAGTIGRYVSPGFIKNSGATGAFNLTLNLQQTPAGGTFVAILPGQSWNFQAWFRDTGPQGQPWSNFTDATRVTFQ